MNKLVSIVSSAALVGATAIVGVAPVTAAPMYGNRDRMVMNYCQTHRGDRECYDFNRNHRHWGDSQYRNFYMHHHDAPGFGAAAAGIFGFAAGAIIAGAAADAARHNSDAHVRACENAYRSYNVRTDMYMGYDGYHHRCML